MWNASKDSILRIYFRDRESVKAFHNNVYLVYLPVCSLRLSHTGTKWVSRVSIET